MGILPQRITGDATHCLGTYRGQISFSLLRNGQTLLLPLWMLRSCCMHATPAPSGNSALLYGGKPWTQLGPQQLHSCVTLQLAAFLQAPHWWFRYHWCYNLWGAFTHHQLGVVYQTWLPLTVLACPTLSLSLSLLASRPCIASWVTFDSIAVLEL